MSPESSHRRRAIFVRRVPIRRHQHPNELLAHLLAPALTEADKERSIVSRLSIQRQVIRVVRRRETGEIGNALAQHLMPIEMEIRKRLVRIVLRGQSFAGRLEVFEILGRPPIRQAAVSIELAS